MYKLRFKGRVFPDHYQVTIEGAPTLHIDNKKINLATTIRFTIKENEITAECTANSLDQRGHGLILQRVHAAVESAVNILTFASGIGHSISIDALQTPDGQTYPVEAEDRELAKLSTAVATDQQRYEAIKLCLSDPELSFAIRDVCDAIKGRAAPEINFARAIETIRQSFVPPGGRKEDGWEPFRLALNASEPYVKTITTMSRGPRHGDYRVVNVSDVREVATRAWTLINRYLEYRLRGSQGLPLSEFPLLD